jgi:hypothetical protein
MLALPEAVPAVGVKVAVLVKPLPLMPPSVPPVVVMSASINPTGASLKVKVIVAVSPTLTAATLLVIASVGASVSTEISRVALVVLPAASVETTVSVSAPCPMASIAAIPST